MTTTTVVLHQCIDERSAGLFKTNGVGFVEGRLGFRWGSMVDVRDSDAAFVRSVSLVDLAPPNLRNPESAPREAPSAH